jgi:hypothetical protein
MENRIKIAADSVQRLRRCDVFRVLEWCPANERAALAEWIVSERADLSNEVAEVMVELA